MFLRLKLIPPLPSPRRRAEPVPMQYAIEMAGKTFARLTVLRRAPKAFRNARWECVCECGGTTTSSGTDLRRGISKSCGCLKRESSAARLRVTNPVNGIPEYLVWQAMKRRCGNSNATNWKDYGGRGIRVCERWLNSFENFLADVGPRPEGKLKSGKALYSIDRFPNNDGNYEPGNTRWATPKQQRANQRPQ